MGTPNYGPDMAKDMRDLRLASARTFTSGATIVREGRPWSSLTVSDYASSRWPSTTSASFTSLQTAGGARSHPNLAYVVKMSVPAAGAELRVIDAAANVILSPIAVTVGSPILSGTFPVPAGLDYYEEFEVYFQARSITAGQTTRLAVAGIYGRS